MSKQDGTYFIHSRQEKLNNLLLSSNIDALALNPGPSLFYFTGLHFHLMERPIVAIFTPGNPIHLVLPELEMAKLENLSYPLKAFPYGEDPNTWKHTFHQALKPVQVGTDCIGIEPNGFRVLELRFLENALPKANFINAEKTIAKLRMYKSDQELYSMRKAAQVAQLAIKETLPTIQIGITEKELARELSANLLRYGSNPKLPFFPIVASGPNSANPHAAPSDWLVNEGDLVVIDWGANVDGYFSDITRTFSVGDIDPEFTQIAQIVAEANATGRAIAKPGISAGEFDKACRTVIANAGYAQYFIHRTGHGIGLEGHEEPYIRDGNKLILEPGMTFTIEPGIYLPNRGGVRIEDDVVITKNGLESLTDLPRELIIIG